MLLQRNHRTFCISKQHSSIFGLSLSLVKYYRSIPQYCCCSKFPSCGVHSKCPGSVLVPTPSSMHQLGIPQSISPRGGKYILPSTGIQILRLSSYSLTQGCPDPVPGGHDPACDHVSTCDTAFLGKSMFCLVGQDSRLDCCSWGLGLNSALIREYLVL